MPKFDHRKRATNPHKAKHMVTASAVAHASVEQRPPLYERIMEDVGSFITVPAVTAGSFYLYETMLGDRTPMDSKLLWTTGILGATALGSSIIFDDVIGVHLPDSDYPERVIKRTTMKFPEIAMDALAVSIASAYLNTGELSASNIKSEMLKTGVIAGMAGTVSQLTKETVFGRD